MDRASIEVRPLDVEEWATFRRIRLRALTDAPHAFASTLRSARDRTERDWRELLAARTQFLATAEGVELGTVGVVTESDSLHLISLWVAPQARGIGVGDLLVRAVITRALDTGHRNIRLEVADGNTAAERLYRRNGFRRTGVHGPVAPGDSRTEFEMLFTRS
ncbi:GNAT family N-acetyltransferase [Nocardia sp. NPDC050710]|uniref:GNAT family N-acetyltransferase n=1 Tax=Nocardia sp. NPDC050710 TaxID=3157220 RepID=UPI0033F3C383